MKKALNRIEYDSSTDSYIVRVNDEIVAEHIFTRTTACKELKRAMSDYHKSESLHTKYIAKNSRGNRLQ